MKSISRAFTILSLTLFLFSCARKPAETKWLTLFNGQDLKGWDTYLGPTYDTIQNKFDSLSIPGLNNDPKKNL